ncbi:polyketide synthase dehydratase domain-containing protein [Streptomyces malaysiensis]|uniref:polyketide synthase dehydratase domain-containing protein n=1 Tax=Streptomyces malaysiensis TaxID=92644 RepID=UPI00202E52C3|nr:polyketide synthase dehydratase domain-containing protein [Streptomyces malaysiensis]
MLRSLAEAYVAGAPVEWARVYGDTGARRVDLPTYPFQRQRFWIRQHGGAGGATTAHGMAATGHALLGSGVPLPGSDGFLFTGRLSLRDQPWLADHSVLGRVVVPGTAFLDMALHAADTVGCDHVTELTLETPLVLTTTGTTHVQVLVAAPDHEGNREISVHARAQDAPPHAWTRHARATLAAGVSGEPAGLGSWPPAGARPVETAGLYERLGDQGLAYGPVFRGLETVWRDGDGALFAEVTLPDVADSDTAGFGVHPALLDAALHAWAAGSDDAGADDAGPGVVRLPFLWSGVTLHATGATKLRVRLTPVASAEGALSVLVTDAAGLPVLSARSLVTRPVTEATFPAPSGTGGSLYRVAWSPVTGSGPEDGPEAGTAPRVAVLGEATESLPEPDPALADCRDLAALEGRLAAGEQPVPDQVLAEVSAPGGDWLPAVVEHTARHALELVQRWLASAHLSAARLVLVTQGAVAAAEGDEPMAGLTASPVWGLVRSAQTEHPGRLALLDLDPRGATPDVVRRALASGEPQLAIRGEEILAPQLVRDEPDEPDETDAPDESTDARHTGPWHLTSARNGTLEDLAWTPVPSDPVSDAVPRLLGAQEVRIEVRAVGLNFRDVLVLLGMYPDAESAVLGSEGAGVVVEVGSGVTDVCVGDRVMGVWGDGFRSVVVVDVRGVVGVPVGWSFEQAASVPVAFVTAYYALVDLAGVRAGESVLVHSAAGGVGMAAVQLARYLGAEVFATASESKWSVVRGWVCLGSGLRRRVRWSLSGCLVRVWMWCWIRWRGVGGCVVAVGAAGWSVCGDGEVGCAGCGGGGGGFWWVWYRAFDLAEAGVERMGEVLREVVGCLRRVCWSCCRWVGDVRRAGEVFGVMRRRGMWGSWC